MKENPAALGNHEEKRERQRRIPCDGQAKPHLYKPTKRTHVMTVEKSLAEALQPPFLSSWVSCSSCASAALTHHLELSLLLLFLLHPPPSLPTHLLSSYSPSGSSSDATGPFHFPWHKIQALVVLSKSIWGRKAILQPLVGGQPLPTLSPYLGSTKYIQGVWN